MLVCFMYNNASNCTKKPQNDSLYKVGTMYEPNSPRNGQQLELSCIYLMGNRKDSEIHNEPSIHQLFCGVPGNGVRVCHHVE